MRLYFFTILIIHTGVTCACSFSGENFMQIHDVSAQAGDTITIKLEIVNEQEFVGFNLDIPLPPSMYFIEGSETLYRDDGHFFMFNVLEGNVARMISASMSNKKFAGNQGVIVSFDVATAPEQAHYVIEPVQAVIGNSAAQDILTNTIQGVIILQ